MRHLSRVFTDGNSWVRVMLTWVGEEGQTDVSTDDSMCGRDAEAEFTTDPLAG